MIKITLILFFFSTIFIFFNCNRLNEKLIITNWQPLNIGDFQIKSKIDTNRNNHYLFKNIDFFIVHENNIDLKKYKIGISINGLIYAGEYKKKITVNNIRILNNGKPLEDLVDLSIWLIDESNRKVAIFTEKNPFFIDKAKCIEFLLKSSFDQGYGNCEIKVKP